MSDSYKKYITEVMDFPKPGIGFKDLSPLIADESIFRSAIVDMGNSVDAHNRCPDYWIGIDSRGYIFAAALAVYFGGGVVCARKEGKTPGDVIKKSYELEYGTATLEMQPVPDMVEPPSAIIVDDVLATGGTLVAANGLALAAGYNVMESLVLIDLKFIPKVAGIGVRDIHVESVIDYE